MAIDNPFDAIKQQYPTDEPNIAAKVSGATGTALSIGGALAVPHLAIPAFLVGQWKKLSDRDTWKERTDATLEIVVNALLALEETHERLDAEHKGLNVRLDDLSSAISVGIANDGTTRDDSRRDRFVSIIAKATISPSRIDDLVSFVQDLDRLTDSDIKALSVLNRVMNQKGDWAQVDGRTGVGLHPNTFLGRRQELAVQMAAALGKAERASRVDTFSREEGLSACLRLQGFGLAEVIASDNRSVPITNYCARPSTRGLMLLHLLGDSVENWERYFDAAGAL